MSNVVYDTFKDMGIEYIVLGEPIHPHRRQRLHISTYVSSAKLSGGRVLYTQVEAKMLGVSIQGGGRVLFSVSIELLWKAERMLETKCSALLRRLHKTVKILNFIRVFYHD